MKEEDKTKLKDYPSILTFVAGRRYGYPCIKVFLKYDDKEAKTFLSKSIKSVGTDLEFVNVTEISNTLRRKNIQLHEERETTSSLYERDLLYRKLEEEEDKIYAKHSSVVAIETSPESLYSRQKKKHYLTLYCLDKDLIPFGEEPVPNELWGYRCVIKEDIVQLGFCENCQELNPGCSIGIPLTTMTGSVGFLARSNKSASQATGFLTAAHVAVEEFEELIEEEIKFSESYCSSRSHYIAHPSFSDSDNSSIIGNVVESFCGNYNSVGIDAAFVRVDKPITKEQVVMRTASENSFFVDGTKVVKKKGRATGETLGLLMCRRYSCKVDKIGGQNITPRFFKNCYSIADKDDKVFFREGDSGSGVFLVDKDDQSKPLGIAFAFQPFEGRTAVCKIDIILEVLEVSILQDKVVQDLEEDMDTS